MSRGHVVIVGPPPTGARLELLLAWAEVIVPPLPDTGPGKGKR